MSNDSLVTLSTIDLIIAVPQVDRQKVKFVLAANGTAEWVIESLTPSVDIEEDHESLPSSSPIPKKTIISGGIMTLFDQEGSMIQSHPVDMPSLESFAAIIQNGLDSHSASEINQAILSMQSIGNNLTLQDIIQNPQIYDAIIEPVSENVVSISMPVSQSPGMGTITDRTVSLIDTTKHLLLASRLYGEEGEIKGTTMIEYDEGPVPYLRGILQQVPDVFPSGQEATMETYSSIESLIITVY